VEPAKAALKRTQSRRWREALICLDSGGASGFARFRPVSPGFLWWEGNVRALRQQRPTWLMGRPEKLQIPNFNRAKSDELFANVRDMFGFLEKRR
jgi:hypothetical protein